MMCGRCCILIGTSCRLRVYGVVYWLEIVVGDVWTVWYLYNVWNLELVVADMWTVWYIGWN